MGKVKFNTLDVFCEAPFQGNPLAVVGDADGVSETRMLAIAKEFDYSETVFVQSPDADGSEAGADVRLRIFTPTGEIPFAGHPTIGAVAWMALDERVKLRDGSGRVVTQQGAGIVPVDVSWDGSGRPRAQLTAAQPPTVAEANLPRTSLAAMLGVDLSEVVDSPAVVSCGSPFLVVPLRSAQALSSCRLSLDRWRELCEPTPELRDVYVIHDGGGRISARMFAPAHGIAEDPATGSAAVALSGLLARGRLDGTHTWVIDQGVDMGRPSVLEVEADVAETLVVAARVGGQAVPVMSGTLRW